MSPGVPGTELADPQVSDDAATGLLQIGLRVLHVEANSSRTVAHTAVENDENSHFLSNPSRNDVDRNSLPTPDFNYIRVVVPSFHDVVSVVSNHTQDFELYNTIRPVI